MVDRIPKRERLMNLVSALLASDGPVAFREIAGRVIGYDDPAGSEALEKRFDRDKADLRRLGIPIEYVPPDEFGKAGYVVDQDEVFQQRVTFTPQEHLLLAIAGRVGAAATGGGALEESLKSALRKLAVDLDGADSLDDLSPVTVLRTRTGDPRTLQNLSVLSQAVTANRSVRFSYCSLHADAAEGREVDPYGLGSSHGAWYLAGWCHVRKALRVFRISRIEGQVQVIGPEGSRAFEVPHDFRIEDHVGKEAWDLGDGQPVTVRLSVEPAVATEGLLPGARAVGSEGGRPLLEVDVRRPGALVPWLLARGGDVAVLEPESLRDAVRAEADRLLARYRGESVARVATSSGANGEREIEA
jgi:proteasome accessory factor B